MTKWPEKLIDESSGRERTEYPRGYNDAIDAYRAALNEACDRKVLADIIAGVLEEDFSATPSSTSFAIADAIRKHLELEDKKEVKP